MLVKKLIGAAKEAGAIAWRKTLHQRLKFSRLLKGETPSTEYDWGCDYPLMVRPDHNDTLFITFPESTQRGVDEDRRPVPAAQHL